MHSNQTQDLIQAVIHGVHCQRYHYATATGSQSCHSHANFMNCVLSLSLVESWTRSLQTDLDHAPIFSTGITSSSITIRQFNVDNLHHNKCIIQRMRVKATKTCFLLYPQVHQPYILPASSTMRAGLQSNTLPFGGSPVGGCTVVSEFWLADGWLLSDSWRQQPANEKPTFVGYKTHRKTSD